MTSVWTDGMNERDQFRLLVHQHEVTTRWLRRAIGNGQGVVSARIVLNLLTEWPEDFAPSPAAMSPNAAQTASTDSLAETAD